ncbi:hypothetical protein SELMODRAFT_431762 [Selaginella moellendorffii]|uniref:Uncharacterized protein n=1 Tax=Selaginella moellendorffii TaxID=88036 RepID=D8TDP7_SELML|nr:hypothetical protein SELMODRAFT_431762 [Selaginella moellendorffii]
MGGEAEKIEGAEVGDSSNARLIDLLDGADFPTLTSHLRRRIVYDVARSLKKTVPLGSIGPGQVVLDFGLRASLAVAEVGEILNKEEILKDLNGHLGLLCYHGIDQIEYDYQTGSVYCCEAPGDLDDEADALNVAYLWSAFVKGENPALTKVRKRLYGMLLSGESTGDILALIAQLQHSSVKQLFLGVVLLEGLGCEANPEVAEQHFELALSMSLDCDRRLRALATYFIARIKVERGQAVARGCMLALANEGNPFAQVFVSRAFASRPVLGSYPDMQFNELAYFVSLASTGYGVSQALAPLYSVLLNDNEKKLLARHSEELPKQLRKLAKRSAESGNKLGRSLWGLHAYLDFIEADECLLSGALCCLCNKMDHAEMWFQRAGKDMGLAFFNLCCEFETANSVWIELVRHKVVQDKLSFSLLAAGLDEADVLNSIDFTRLRSIELVLEASRYMPSPAADELMQRFCKRYVESVDGLRFLAGLYRRRGKLEAAMECYVAAAKYEGGSDAMVDISVMFLEGGDVVKAEVWGRKAELAAEMLVSGMLALQEQDVHQALECFKVAADADDPRAMWLIGEIMRSEEWLGKAARFGFCHAFDSLGEMKKYTKDVDGFWECKRLKEEYCKTSWRFTRRDAFSDSRIVATFQKWRINL